MKIFYSEYQKDYSTYTFSYAPYCFFESIGEITEIYRGGFLPYTGNPELRHYLYYKARSLRIDLSKFEMGSENRRVDRKFDGFIVASTWIEIDQFDREDAGFLEFCTEYSRDRFKGGGMSPERLTYILNTPFLTDIIQYEVNGRLAGYVFVSRNSDVLHYWYSFYELEEFQDLPLGKYMMMDVIRQAKDLNLSYCYLGTCYGIHSLYKVRDFKGVEFSDGSFWSTDVKQLKERCKGDEGQLPSDRFKEMDHSEANAYLSKLLDADTI